MAFGHADGVEFESCVERFDGKTSLFSLQIRFTMQAIDGWGTWLEFYSVLKILTAVGYCFCATRIWPMFTHAGT